MVNAYQSGSYVGLEPSGMEYLVVAYQATIISVIIVYNAQQEPTLMEKHVPHRLMPQAIALPMKYT